MSTNNHHTSRHRGNGRDDCWTESETETLVNAWGDRYVQLNRGNLRQNDWSDVAAAVNATRDRSKPPRSDVQCKNRIDTLKKKYKLEKSKPEPSKWPLFHRMDELIGAGSGSGSKKAVGRGVVESISKPNPNPNPNSNLKLKGGLGVQVESLDWGNGETAYAELARAIGRVGEVYERMERLKQEEMMKMEKERMEFTKEVEVRRMNMFVESQVEIEKMKREKVKKKKRLSGADSLSSGKKPQR